MTESCHFNAVRIHGKETFRWLHRTNDTSNAQFLSLLRMTTGEDDTITVESTLTGYGHSDTHDHNNTHVFNTQTGSLPTGEERDNERM